MVDISAAWLHRFYLTEFSQQSPQLLEVINSQKNCESVALNMIVSKFTGIGPVALTPKFDNFRVKTSSSKKGSLYRYESTKTGYELGFKTNYIDLAIFIIYTRYAFL